MFSIAFSELYALYAKALPERLARLDKRLFCKVFDILFQFISNFLENSF